MSRGLYLALLIAVTVGIQPVLARPMYDNEPPPASSVQTPNQAPAQPRVMDYTVPQDIHNNQYFLESQRLARLAQENYNYGDYDASYGYAQDAMQYALLSDVHVAIATAKYRIDWAVSSGASGQYPAQFADAQSWYNNSLRAREREEWENAIAAANRVVDLIASIHAPEHTAATASQAAVAGTSSLPAAYTVRAWTTSRDCFWTIAGRPWVYNDSHKWRTLYNANRAKLPNPDDPNVIEPGTVLDIPGIKGEYRQGAWESGKTYRPLD